MGDRVTGRVALDLQESMVGEDVSAPAWCVVELTVPGEGVWTEGVDQTEAGLIEWALAVEVEVEE